jgi:hypothetical protein
MNSVANEDTGYLTPNHGAGGGTVIPHIYKFRCKCPGIRKACRAISSVSLKPSTKFSEMVNIMERLTRLLLDKQAFYHAHIFEKNLIYFLVHF